MKLESTSSKQNIIRRLNRIEGQIKGITNMIGNERDCHEILQQMTAVRSAMQSAMVSFTREYLHQCLAARQLTSEEEKNHMLDELIHAINFTSHKG